MVEVKSLGRFAATLTEAVVRPRWAVFFKAGAHNYTYAPAISVWPPDFYAPAPPCTASMAEQLHELLTIAASLQLVEERSELLVIESQRGARWGGVRRG